MARRRAVLRDELITLAHGAGGKATRDLVEALFLEELGNEALSALGDAAVVPGGGRLALSTDSYVVHPLEFPGGDIGELAVNGTVNDLAMVGARPLWLTAGFVIEEGFPVADLRRIVASMGAAARAAGVAVVAGDTKVVERGKADGLYVTTAGRRDAWPTASTSARTASSRATGCSSRARSPTTGWPSWWRAATSSSRPRSRATPPPCTSSPPALVALGPALRWMRDPTRGGLATALNELAEAAGLAVVLDESRAAGATGGQRRLRDPRHRPALRRERGQADRDRRGRGRRRGARRAPRRIPSARTPSCWARCAPSRQGSSCSTRRSEARRIVDMLVGDPLPRIC